MKVNAYIVSEPADWYELKAYPGIAELTTAERVEIVEAMGRLRGAGVVLDTEDAAYLMDEVCNLPDGTSARLHMNEWGPMRD